MNQYQIQMKRLLAWCQSCDWCVSDYHQLFQMMFNYTSYEKLRLNSPSVDVQIRAAESVESARNILIDFMYARCFPEIVKRAVWYMAKTQQ